jgi:hypothetical protein
MRTGGSYPEGMAKTWVLQTETKGTGATMVPIERTAKPASAPTPVYVPRAAEPREPEAPRPRTPRRFRVVDLMTRETLIDDAPAAPVIEVLKDVRSTVDVTISVWDEHRERWRPLTLSEQRAMFAFSRSPADAPPDPA